MIPINLVKRAPPTGRKEVKVQVRNFAIENVYHIARVRICVGPMRGKDNVFATANYIDKRLFLIVGHVDDYINDSSETI